MLPEERTTTWSKYSYNKQPDVGSSHHIYGCIHICRTRQSPPDIYAGEKCVWCGDIGALFKWFNKPWLHHGGESTESKPVSGMTHRSELASDVWEKHGWKPELMLRVCDDLLGFTASAFPPTATEGTINDIQPPKKHVFLQDIYFNSLQNPGWSCLFYLPIPLLLSCLGFQNGRIKKGDCFNR